MGVAHAGPRDHWGQICQTMLYAYQTWSEQPLIQAYDDGDLHGGQRSSEVKYGKLCAMAIIYSKDPQMQAKNDDDLHGGQRSTEVKRIENALWQPNLVRRTADAS